ncbi:MAG: hypothetical protein FVQ83_11880 [Chloroflexi bacterium]|nr:hypothetical protein [Chloroflexota bacterium]
MKKIKVFANITAILCFFAMLGLLFSYLALTDIWHNTEPDLTGEWMMMQLNIYVEFILIASVLILLLQVNKYFRAD